MVLTRGTKRSSRSEDSEGGVGKREDLGKGRGGEKREKQGKG